VKRIAIIKVMPLVSVLLFSGCAIFTLYADFGQLNSYRYKEVLTFQSPRPDILDVVAEVAESLGYRVLVLDIGAGHIEMSKKESFLSAFFTGKGARANLVINSMDEGKKLNISFMVSGKRGAGEREQGIRVLADFKQQLLERIGQQ
jgi:hypothetical protein